MPRFPGFKYGPTWQVSSHVVNGPHWGEWVQSMRDWTRKSCRVPDGVDIELVGMVPLRRGLHGALHAQDEVDEQTAAYIVCMRWWQQ